MTIDSLDLACCEDATLTGSDGVLWQDRPRRHRRGILRACMATMPANPDDDTARAHWPGQASAQCSSAILTVIGMALLSWLIQRICEMLYQRWKQKHPSPGLTPPSGPTAAKPNTPLDKAP